MPQIKISFLQAFHKEYRLGHTDQALHATIYGLGQASLRKNRSLIERPGLSQGGQESYREERQATHIGAGPLVPSVRGHAPV